jgi:hypothetical protein
MKKSRNSRKRHKVQRRQQNWKNLVGAVRPEQRLNIGQSAAYMGISRAQFQRIMDEIPHEKYLSQVRIFNAADLDAYRQKHSYVPEPLMQVMQAESPNV